MACSLLARWQYETSNYMFLKNSYNEAFKSEGGGEGVEEGEFQTARYSGQQARREKSLEGMCELGELVFLPSALRQNKQAWK